MFSFLIELFEGNAAGWFTDYLLSPGVLIVPGIMFVLSIILSPELYNILTLDIKYVNKKDIGEPVQCPHSAPMILLMD